MILIEGIGEKIIIPSPVWPFKVTENNELFIWDKLTLHKNITPFLTNASL